MSLTDIILHPRKAVAIAKPVQHIFFLSHMRAYSSLFGHLMGSHPQISGYYEMHIGYHSWKSLVRQKLRFFQDEEPKAGFRYMFDKVLHSEHHVAIEILNSGRARPIFSLRNPGKTIPSIMKLYAREDPAHPFNDPEFSTQYYIDRARSLVSITEELDYPYFYLDAEAITQETERCLAALTQWLNLCPPLDSSYEVQKRTSQSRYGDTSEQLKSGKIENVEHVSGESALPPRLLEQALESYHTCREAMRSRSAVQCILES